MNIALFDSWNGKFSKDIQRHWESLGHNVVTNGKWDILEQSDVNFFYQADNTAVEGTKKPKKGKTFVHCVDIEVWAGQASAVNWENVDGALFMAKHIKDMVNVGTTPSKVIRPGIDINKWTLKPENTSNIRKIAYVVGNRRIWDVKRLDIAMQLLKDLMTSGRFQWELHIRGTYSSHAQYNAYCKHLEEDLDIKDNLFWHEDRVEDLNQWLDDKDYFLLPSTKEAFSYATAEAMCKGIKPIINNWQGAKDKWGVYVSETPGQMLYGFLREPINREEYREFIVNYYNQERYFKELDDFVKEVSIDGSK